MSPPGSWLTRRGDYPEESPTARSNFRLSDFVSANVEEMITRGLLLSFLHSDKVACLSRQLESNGSREKNL